MILTPHFTFVGKSNVKYVVGFLVLIYSSTNFDFPWYDFCPSHFYLITNLTIVEEYVKGLQATMKLPMSDPSEHWCDALKQFLKTLSRHFFFLDVATSWFLNLITNGNADVFLTYSHIQHGTSQGPDQAHWIDHSSVHHWQERGSFGVGYERE
jgi:hypothetical protein